MSGQLVPELGWQIRRATAASIICACSFLWLLAEPVAGLAEAGRKIPKKESLAEQLLAKLDRKYRQAPMFSGSPCTQMTGARRVNAQCGTKCLLGPMDKSCSNRRMAISSLGFLREVFRS